MKGRKTPHYVRAAARRNPSLSVRAAPTDGTAVENARWVGRGKGGQETVLFINLICHQVEDWDEHADECSG